jgi:hypothetical protein
VRGELCTVNCRRTVKLIEIAETLKISKKRVELIVHEYLDIRKLCAKWVPRVLTIDQNQQRVDDLDFGAMFSDIRRNKDEFFRRYITKDVTWRQSSIDSQAN